VRRSGLAQAGPGVGADGDQQYAAARDLPVERVEAEPIEAVLILNTVVKVTTQPFGRG